VIILSDLLIYNMQKFSVHDGPGVRTTVFLKGCPLTCLWCHNPESQNRNQTVFTNHKKCINCQMCKSVCVNEDCILCGLCVDVCPADARQMIGDKIQIGDVFTEVMNDIIFYEQSGGGVTFSGGEPLLQSKRLKTLLERLKDKGVHTAIDTCGYVSVSAIDEVSEYVDLWLYDLKHSDNQKHIELTGVGNELILTNLLYLKNQKANIWVRFPLIPTYNDDVENIKGIAEILNELNMDKIYVLPYHNLAEDKHDRFNLDYKLAGLSEPTDELIQNVIKEFNKHNIKVNIGGATHE